MRDVFGDGVAGALASAGWLENASIDIGTGVAMEGESVVGVHETLRADAIYQKEIDSEY